MVKEKDVNLSKNFATDNMMNFVKIQNKQIAQKIIHIKFLAKIFNPQVVVLSKNHIQVIIVIIMKSLNLFKHLYMKYKDVIHDVFKQ